MILCCILSTLSVSSYEVVNGVIEYGIIIRAYSLKIRLCIRLFWQSDRVHAFYALRIVHTSLHVRAKAVGSVIGGPFSLHIGFETKTNTYFDILLH